MSIPLRPLGRHTDVMVSALCLGGYHLGRIRSVRESVRVSRIKDSPKMRLDGVVTDFTESRASQEALEDEQLRNAFRAAGLRIAGGEVSGGK